MAEVISISVDSKAAKIFNSANRKQRQKVQKLVSSLLKYGGQTSLDSHLNRMDKISEKAAAKGLTEKRLDSLLIEDLLVLDPFRKISILSPDDFLKRY